ncbi:uncharacterized protein BYT42DRAFT_566389 [Radiomyces spectabilis]|uniref:uncharacterized protein n=1 Tax=Radiomyces spectabilis TaxID=64574 RepID=UPI00221E8C59|nr:uncharacterized protein BYT42DRAFT_566389 [Radiomyces spectabilis]KAI8381401.1 hypothetical protein BYT42DRAFT_566389 [Radiomyces spectabilis]
MQPATIIFLTCDIFCLLSTVLIAYPVIRYPKKLRTFIACFSLSTLPACVVNTLTQEGILADRWNSLTYLVSTLLMFLMHFWMLLDLAHRIRYSEACWRHWLVRLALAGLLLASTSLLLEIGFMFARNEDFPVKSAFITGVFFAIVSDGAIFNYTFLPLIRLGKNRTEDYHSKTTALGLWFMVIQGIWFTLYGALYLWFIISNTWSFFRIMLAFDYVFRFILCLMFTWPPPKRIIQYMTSHLSTSAAEESTNRGSRKTTASCSHNMSSERYNHNADEELAIKEPPNSHSIDPYASDVAILAETSGLETVKIDCSDRNYYNR